MHLDDTKIKLLSENQINDIQTHLDLALENDHGSGDHWILMSLLDKMGIRTNSPIVAMDVAERVIVRWHQLKQT